MTSSERRGQPPALAILRGQGGQTAILALLCMITLFGFVALVASMGRLVVEKIRLQSAADLSAFSGAAIQAAGLNELARINEKIRDDIDYFERGEKTYRSQEAGEDAIERRMKQRVEEVIKQVRAYAQRARLRAGEAARHNYPGVEAYQVGVQVDPDSDDASMTREELRRFAARNDKGTNIKFYYRDDDGDRRRGSHDPDFLRTLHSGHGWRRRSSHRRCLPCSSSMLPTESS
jgi:hypothetical protein